MQSYADHASRLIADGKGYYCFCSAETLEAHRKSQLAAGLPPKYAGTCRNIPAADAQRRKDAGEAPVIRLRVPEGRNVTFNDIVRGEVTFHTDVIGDPVLVRSDGVPAYNFAVVIDDALMKVTHVIRGEDHISNTPRQVLVYEAFDYQPPAFAHLSLARPAPASRRPRAAACAPRPCRACRRPTPPAGRSRWRRARARPRGERTGGRRRCRESALRSSADAR